MNRAQSLFLTLLFSLAYVSVAQDAPKPTQAAQPAGEPTDPSKISVKVNVVNVLATVRDKHDKITEELRNQYNLG